MTKIGSGYIVWFDGEWLWFQDERSGAIWIEDYTHCPYYKDEKFKLYKLEEIPLTKCKCHQCTD